MFFSLAQLRRFFELEKLAGVMGLSVWMRETRELRKLVRGGMSKEILFGNSQKIKADTLSSCLRLGDFLLSQNQS